MLSSLIPRLRRLPPHRRLTNETSRVTIVDTPEKAARIVSQLFSLPTNSVVAWDTETTNVNPALQTPVGNGRILCATAYAGHHVDFGSGPRLFVDFLASPSMMPVFKPYFEHAACAKVWHNYAFDRHIFGNHDVECSGFRGDSMHMARLTDSSLLRYSLQNVADVFLDGAGKNSMKDLFGRFCRLKNGEWGKTLFVPDTLYLHTCSKLRDEWLSYATLDAELTYRAYHVLKHKLESIKLVHGNEMRELLLQFDSLFHLYEALLVPFGQALTDIERVGFKIDVAYLRKAEMRATDDMLILEDKFRTWAMRHSPDAKFMNIHSTQQKQQLFFAPCKNKRSGISLPCEKKIRVELTGNLKQRYISQLAESKCENDRKRHAQLTSEKGRDKKIHHEIVLRGMKNPYVETTSSGWPSVSAKAMSQLAETACSDATKEAVRNMIEATSISTLSTTFIRPLQTWPGHDGRIHASLNLNTETGRLSSRRPNLQNQPALEKDRYRIRGAFICESGNTLIVADYGQLELRLLAHITGCQSMIEAFKAGGDFHSRTAVTMFDHVASAVRRGECRVEREGAETGGVPLVKEAFATERRQAKTLNFSIAYGKTSVGLARDWGVSEGEASETVALWYRERQEVRKWQKKCIEFVCRNLYVETILGRRRHLPDIKHYDFGRRRHAERAAINAPLQGSAADLVMAAIVKLHGNRVLNMLGWKVVLQVHDEIILEGPECSADIAIDIVKEDMRDPVGVPLLVDLEVDTKCAKSWYAAK